MHESMGASHAPANNTGGTEQSAYEGNPEFSPMAGLPSRLATEQAYARRCELVNQITADLKDAGIHIPTEGGMQFDVILAMTANAFVPETFCTIIDPDKRAKLALYPGGTKEVLHPPDIALQQDICRHFREQPGLRDLLAENFALSLYLGHPLNWMGNSAIELREDGLLSAGTERFHTLSHNSGTIYVPGCGLTSFAMIQKFLDKQAQAEGEGIRFLLSDNHPFVADIASRYCRYLADKRVQFFANSMEEVHLPEDTKTVLLSYIEAAGEQPIKQMLQNLRASPSVTVIVVAGISPNEYSRLSGKALIKLCEDAGFMPYIYPVCDSFSTHLTIGGHSVDFLDLNPSQALYVFSLGLNGQSPNTRSLIACLRGKS